MSRILFFWGKKQEHQKKASLFNFTYRYIKDFLFISNPYFLIGSHNYIPPELEFKETSNTAFCVSVLVIDIEFDKNSHFSTKIDDKRDDFNNENFPPSFSAATLLAYGVYVFNSYHILEVAASFQTFGVYAKIF